MIGSSLLTFASHESRSWFGCESWLDDFDLDIRTATFVPERLIGSFQRMFGCVVIAEAGECHTSTDRCVDH